MTSRFEELGGHGVPPGLKMATGGPGIAPHWTGSAKEAVGTAYSTSSHIWFTIAQGMINEIYYPTIDHPQIRDLQYLITDGESFFCDERHMNSELECLSHHALGFRLTNSDPEGRYRLFKEIISDPHQPVLLMRTRLQAQAVLRHKLRLFLLLAPHLGGDGWGNDGEIVSIAGRMILSAHKGDTWLALGASLPFLQGSCGYVGVNDGWSDLADNYELDSQFHAAYDGNIALTAQLDLSRELRFTTGLAFGETFHHAVTALFQSLGVPFREQRKRFIAQWEPGCKHIRPLEKTSGDEGRLYHTSQSLLLAHEDKSYPGAMIASLSIPWGEVKGDEDRGGYHLVWTRDLVNSAGGLLAAGNTATPLRALIYLATAQRPDGGFYQNFWIDGQPYWNGIQLDEVAFPILLAWRLHRLGALGEFDPYPMVQCAAAYLIRHGPATPQERWEEASGYSPSTLAVNIAALICAAGFAGERGDAATAKFIQEYADFLECHLERWTVTTMGTLVPGLSRHYLRIHPVKLFEVQPDENPNHGLLTLANQPPGQRQEFPAKDIVDAGFLELVRYGIRRPDDRLIEDSLQVVDALLKVDTPYGPCWHRYNHDGYGQRADGGPYQGWGVGRAWPLLTGERGHYELAAGRPVQPFIRALERFAHSIGLLTEQVWDEPDRPELQLYLGRPTGAAMPLMWAHAEYIKLLRSAYDRQIFDFIPEVAQRYLVDRRDCQDLEIWKLNRQPHLVRPGTRLRIQAPEAFWLRWTQDEWQEIQETRSTPTQLGIEYIDLPIAARQRAPIRFTFRWVSGERWEGRDYQVAIDV